MARYHALSVWCLEMEMVQYSSSIVPRDDTIPKGSDILYYTTLHETTVPEDGASLVVHEGFLVPRGQVE